MHYRRHLSDIFLVTSTCLLMGLGGLGGCNTTERGVSNTAINSQQMNTEKSVPVIAQAAVSAFEKLDLRDIKRRNTQTNAQVTGYTASNTPVRLYARQIEEGQSRIRIRVGTLGDQKMGVTVMRKVKTQLGLPAQPKSGPTLDRP